MNEASPYAKYKHLYAHIYTVTADILLFYTQETEISISVLNFCMTNCLLFLVWFGFVWFLRCNWLQVIINGNCIMGYCVNDTGAVWRQDREMLQI